MAGRSENKLLISAQTGEGVEAFKAHLSAMIARGHDIRNITLNADNGAALAWLHDKGSINHQVVDGELVHVEASLSRQLWGQFEKKFPYVDEKLEG